MSPKRQPPAPKKGKDGKVQTLITGQLSPEPPSSPPLAPEIRGASHVIHQFGSIVSKDLIDAEAADLALRIPDITELKEMYNNNAAHIHRLEDYIKKIDIKQLNDCEKALEVQERKLEKRMLHFSNNKAAMAALSLLLTCQYMLLQQARFVKPHRL